MTTSSRNRPSISGFDKIFIPAGSAKLARTHMLIRIEKEKEIVFLKICSQIRLNDLKKKRSERQKEERRSKRYREPINTYQILG